MYCQATGSLGEGWGWQRVGASSQGTRSDDGPNSLQEDEDESDAGQDEAAGGSDQPALAAVVAFHVAVTPGLEA